MTEKCFQDYYPDEYSHCYGCGRLNNSGMRIKSFWDGDESICRHTPAQYYTGGFSDKIYGGLIASLMDCHCAGTAAAAKHRAEGFELGERPIPRFVTASLKVDYLKPTPAGIELEVRAKVVEMKNRKVVLHAELIADGIVTAKGEAIMVQIPEEPK